MKSGELFSCVITVAWDGLALLHSAPKRLTEMMYGSILEDNPFHGYPDDPGVYECLVKVTFDDSYVSEDDDQESDVDFDPDDNDMHFFVQESERVS